jgi:hypothetical protein
MAATPRKGPTAKIANAQRHFTQRNVIWFPARFYHGESFLSKGNPGCSRPLSKAYLAYGARSSCVALASFFI